MKREAKIHRKTKETNIKAKILINESWSNGKLKGTSNNGFFDHMIEQFCFHGRFDVELALNGDYHVDAHHSIEDLGIVFGQCINKIVEKSPNVRRYYTKYIPMDDVLSRVSVDVCGRPFLYWGAENIKDIGKIDGEVFKEFFKSFAFSAKINLHISNLYGSNNHHIIESIFKAFGISLHKSLMLEGSKVQSTKGSL